MLSKIAFKPSAVDQLAGEAGIGPGVLDFLRERGLTSVAEIRRCLRDAEGGEEEKDVDEAVKDMLGDGASPTPPAEPGGSGEAGPGGSAGGGSGGGGRGGSSGGGGRGSGGGRRPPGSAGLGPFISYVATHADEEGRDPDGLDEQRRMALEEQAIQFIETREPLLERTPTNNPGFDLFEAGPNGQPARWVEVKAMTGNLSDRPVGMSRTQFDEALKRGERYWLYVVEQAGTDNARLVRVRDPAGKARTFTFDHGWRAVAETDQAKDSQEHTE
ncbi:MAG: DUF3883 domain-containing protein [Phycisphaerae bacterium]|nr:DUF3883 domain-containing protein [Phycisphaerae bacterium]